MSCFCHIFYISLNTLSSDQKYWQDKQTYLQWIIIQKRTQLGLRKNNSSTIHPKVGPFLILQNWFQFRTELFASEEWRKFSMKIKIPLNSMLKTILLESPGQTLHLYWALLPWLWAEVGEEIVNQITHSHLMTVSILTRNKNNRFLKSWLFNAFLEDRWSTGCSSNALLSKF